MSVDAIEPENAHEPPPFRSGLAEEPGGRIGRSRQWVPYLDAPVPHVYLLEQEPHPGLGEFIYIPKLHRQRLGAVEESGQIEWLVQSLFGYGEPGPPESEARKGDITAEHRANGILGRNRIHGQYLTTVRSRNPNPEQSGRPVESRRAQAGNHDLAVEAPLDPPEHLLHHKRLPGAREEEENHTDDGPQSERHQQTGRDLQRLANPQPGCPETPGHPEAPAHPRTPTHV